MSIVKFDLVMYGDYKCSCGCGKALGTPSALNITRCKGVGDENDEEGYDYRMFTKECWERLNFDALPAHEIYENYKPCEEV